MTDQPEHEHDPEEEREERRRRPPPPSPARAVIRRPGEPPERREPKTGQVKTR